MSTANENVKVIDVAREILGVDDEEILEAIIWGCTGWPCFWNRKDGKTAEECFRSQLWQAKIALQQGFTINEIFEGKSALIEKEQMKINRLFGSCRE